MTKTEAITELRRILRMRHYALTTEDNYVHWTGRFFDWLGKHAREVDAAPAARMEGFLSDLARADVSASTQNQAFSALLFFYRNVLKQEPGNVNALRARRPKFLRHAPARGDVAKILAAVEDTPAHPFRLITFMIYGCGLRVSEPLGIRIREVDLENKRIIIRQAKQNKDRMIPLPDVLLEPIRRQIEAARVVWRRAMAAGVPVKLPHGMERKAARYGREFSWFWLFPMANACDDPRSGARVWWHCLPTGVQKALAKAAARTGLGGAVTPHHLRHAWATHAADAGANLRDIQEILGHKSLETTMIYVHPEIERVTSPLECLPVRL